MLPGLCHIPRSKWNIVSWWRQSSNPGQLNAFLRFPEAHPKVEFYVLPKPSADPSRPQTSHADAGTVILIHEPQDDGHRFYVFGNHAANSSPDYTSAIASILASNLTEVKFSALPESAISVADALFREAQYQQYYSTPCWQYSLGGPPPAHIRSTWQQLVENIPSGYTLGSLLPEDAELVNDTWRFK